MTGNETLQDFFLKELCRDKVQVSIFLINGIKLHGIVDSFDSSVVLLKNSVTQIVYKHAISTVVPSRMIKSPAGTDATHAPG